MMADQFPKTALASEMVRYARTFLGVPYRWGGDDPMEGIDCSGLAIECLQGVGLLPMKFDATADGLYEYFVPPMMLAGQSRSVILKPVAGCLVFYFKNGRAYHVGIYTNSGLYITADGGRRGTISEEIAAAQNAFVKLRPVSSRRDPVFVDPDMPPNQIKVMP